MKHLLFYLKVHGPCVNFSSVSQCLDKKGLKCDKYFPKKYQEHTTTTETGFTSYRRRDPEHNGHTLDNVKVRGKRETVQISNKWIVA